MPRKRTRRKSKRRLTPSSLTLHDLTQLILPPEDQPEHILEFLENYPKYKKYQAEPGWPDNEPDPREETYK